MGEVALGESGGNEMEEVLVEELSQEESEEEIWQRRERVGREEELGMLME